ncbi:putative basal body component [Trypanosoma cruzi]|nr:putative basal body component [Trypanosoma cruzi]
MVSLRYLREQQEAAMRRARFEEARRIGSAIGVQRARAYAAQKSAQAVKVREDMRKQWECEVQQQAALIDRVLYDGQSRLGEGMRGAAELTAAQQRHASDEINAWVAEHALERERHRIARATERVTRALQDEPHRSIVGRKKAVREVEDKRSKTRIARPSPRPPSFASHGSPLAGALSHTAIMQARTPTPVASVVMVTADNDDRHRRAARGEAAAVQFAEERKRELAGEREKLQQCQRGAAERAAAYLSERDKEAKEAREAARRRAANMAALEQRIVAEPQDDNSVSGKELETRRVAVLKAQEEVEFGQLFLSGPLPLNDELGLKEDNDDADEMCPFPLPSVSCLLPGESEVVVQLHPRPFHVYPIPEEAPADADDAEEKATSEAGSNAPNAVSVAPQPTPMSPQVVVSTKLNSSPFRTLRSSEQSLPLEVPPSSSLSLPPPPPPPPPLSLCPSAATAKKPDVAQPNLSTHDEPPNLALHHEQFLRNLKALQDKLAKVSSDSADVNETVDVSTCHGNVTLSSMSSPLSMARRPGKETREDEYEAGATSIDTSANSGSSSNGGSSSTSSSGPSTSSVYSRSYPTMTAEQLKAALLKLKLRMRSA